MEWSIALEELRLIYSLFKQDWKIRFRQVSRSQNKIVDHMTKIILSGLYNVQLFWKPLDSVKNIVIVERSIFFFKSIVL